MIHVWKAIYQLIRGSSAITGKAVGGVHAVYAPDGTVKPYVVMAIYTLGEPDRDTEGSAVEHWGVEFVIYGGQRTVMELQELVEQLVLTSELVLDQGELMAIEKTSSDVGQDVRRDKDGSEVWIATLSFDVEVSRTPGH